MNVIKQAFTVLLVTLFSALAEANQTETIVFGMGCFWGAEKRFSALPGVLDVESGYAGGDAAKVTYRDLFEHERLRKEGKTKGRNHAEVIKVTFDPARVDAKILLIKFWENHDPTQGNRQGNDVGSNYRSAIYYTSEAQKAKALETRDVYQAALRNAGNRPITTEIAPLRHYNRAETYHQDYLMKNPDGYCGLGGTGVPYPDVVGRREPAMPLSAAGLDFTRQLIVFEAADCPFCKQFKADILAQWQSVTPIVTTLTPKPPVGWKLEKTLFATPPS